MCVDGACGQQEIVCLVVLSFVRKTAVSTSPALPDRLNRIIRPLEAILAGRGSRRAEPARKLLIALLVCFLIWKLRRLAGMVTGNRGIGPKPRRAAATKAAVTASRETPEIVAAMEIDPGIPGPDTPPPDEPSGPVEQTPDEAPYGDALRRLIQQPEMLALLKANPQLKAALRRLLHLLGSEPPQNRRHRRERHAPISQNGPNRPRPSGRRVGRSVGGRRKTRSSIPHGGSRPGGRMGHPENSKAPFRYGKRMPISLRNNNFLAYGAWAALRPEVQGKPPPRPKLLPPVSAAGIRPRLSARRACRACPAATARPRHSADGGKQP